MALNPYFLQGSSTEQNLVQSLINEQIKMYGVDVYYIPRRYMTKTTVIQEVIESKFEEAIPLEAYVDTFDGYEGQGSLLSKFGVQALDEQEPTRVYAAPPFQAHCIRRERRRGEERKRRSKLWRKGRELKLTTVEALVLCNVVQHITLFLLSTASLY